MPDPVALSSAIVGGGFLCAGMLAQVRAHRVRESWSSAGRGIEERSTGLASLAAIPVLFPTELDSARATGTQLAVLVLRRFSEHPEQYGRRLAAATRAHETGWRIDYDLFAVTIIVRDRDDAVHAAARIGRASCGEESTRDLRIGIAMCPTDATDLLEAAEIGMRRMRGFGLLDAVARQLRQVDADRSLEALDLDVAG